MLYDSTLAWVKEYDPSITEEMFKRLPSETEEMAQKIDKLLLTFDGYETMYVFRSINEVLKKYKQHRCTSERLDY